MLQKIFRSLREATLHQAVKRIAHKFEQATILVVDNPKMAFQIDDVLKKCGARSRFVLAYSHHGFDLGPSLLSKGLQNVTDELIYLTESGYRSDRTNAYEMNCEISIVGNPLDLDRFSKPTLKEKEAIRDALELSKYKTVFLWLSRDVPKKGLHIVLGAWREFSAKHEDCALLVIGSSKRVSGIPNVFMLGRRPHKEIADYFKAADVYLFPTLCREGFGLSLLEAMLSGCLCIASQIGSVPEILASVKHGLLVATPNSCEAWIAKMEEAYAILQGGADDELSGNTVKRDNYSFENWTDAYESIFEKWESRMRMNCKGQAIV